MFFDNPVAAFINIRQALQFGGRIAFICWQPLDANQWVSLPLEVASNHMEVQAPSGSEEPGPFSFGDANKVTCILVEAGFIDVSIENYHTPLNVGADLNEAVTFLTHIGPASKAIEMSNADEPTRARIVAELRDTLTRHETEQGVTLNAATWIVTASNS